MKGESRTQRRRRRKQERLDAKLAAEVIAHAKGVTLQQIKTAISEFLNKNLLERSFHDAIFPTLKVQAEKPHDEDEEKLAHEVIEHAKRKEIEQTLSRFSETMKQFGVTMQHAGESFSKALNDMTIESIRLDVQVGPGIQSGIDDAAGSPRVGAEEPKSGDRPRPQDPSEPGSGRTG